MGTVPLFPNVFFKHALDKQQLYIVPSLKCLQKVNRNQMTINTETGLVLCNTDEQMTFSETRIYVRLRLCRAEIFFKVTFESMHWQGKGTDTNRKVSEPKFRVKVIAVNSW